jgi:hypothetical protein
MAQHARLQVAYAAVGIDQVAVGRLRNGVDGQVAAGEILVERDLGTEIDGEPPIAGGYFALEPRQRVLLVGCGVQKNRKVAPDLPIIQAQQLFAGATDHHPIALLYSQAEQGVPNGSANQIHLHA